MKKQKTHKNHPRKQSKKPMRKDSNMEKPAGDESGTLSSENPDLIRDRSDNSFAV